MSIRRTLILLFVCLVSQPSVSLGQEAPRSFSLGKLTSACELFENQLRTASSGPVTVEGAGAGFCSGFIWAVAGFSHFFSNSPNNDCSKGLGPNCRPVLGICLSGSMSDKQMGTCSSPTLTAMLSNGMKKHLRMFSRRCRKPFLANRQRQPLISTSHQRAWI